MKCFFLAACLVAGSLGSSGVLHAHGGPYPPPPARPTDPPKRGDWTSMPPPGSSRGSGASAPLSPASPAGAGPGAPATLTPSSGGPGLGPDLTRWEFWWELNKAPYLDLRRRLHTLETETGSEGWFLGRGESRQGRQDLRPSAAQIREEIVPALLRALQEETDNHIVTGCLVALAKIGDPPGATDSRLEPVLREFLRDSNQEIRETAAVALGILASPSSIATLEQLLRNTSQGRHLVGKDSEVDYRTRAFAAYGLGLVGARAGSEADRARIVRILREVLELDATRTRDVQVSCLIAMGLVPLQTIESPPSEDAPPRTRGRSAPAPAEVSRLAQLDFLLRFLADGKRHYLARAHCPTALARLLSPESRPEPRLRESRERVATVLLELIDEGKEPPEILQSCVLALGRIGTSDDGAALDARILATLASAPRQLSDLQARQFALIALARIAGAAGDGERSGGIATARKALLGQLADGKNSIQPWAGLACGVLAHELAVRKHTDPAVFGSLQQAVRAALENEKNPACLGAYAIACGLMDDVEAIPLLRERLRSVPDDTATGHIALALGLMRAREAQDDLRRLVDDSRFRPERLRQCAIALGLLGDKDIVRRLAEQLADARGLFAQAALANALGVIGDAGSIAPLVALLQDPEVLGQGRGLAAAALGLVAEKEPWPWNTKIALDLNYRAAAPTLMDVGSRTGILDLL